MECSTYKKRLQDAETEKKEVLRKAEASKSEELNSMKDIIANMKASLEKERRDRELAEESLKKSLKTGEDSLRKVRREKDALKVSATFHLNEAKCSWRSFSMLR